jgi:CBS domain containing-hemolysin-like protein
MKEKETSLEDEPEQGLWGLIKAFARKRAHLGTSNDLAEEIHDLIDEGEAKGFISNEESHMVYGVLDLKETRAQSIMVPRTDISSASVNSTLGEVIRLVRACGHTRIPIHNDNIDEIVGILHAKDLLKLYGESPDSQIPSSMLRKPLFVPHNQNVGSVLKSLKEKKTHLAIVTDEYGGTAGIITIEDILEEIVGEILDEHDKEEPLLSVVDSQTLVVDARLEIRKLEEHLGVEFPEGEYESVGGFLIHLTGSIPKPNEKIAFFPFEFIIQTADQRKINKIQIIRVSNGAQPPSGQEPTGEAS